MSFQMIRDSLLQEKQTGKQWDNPGLFFDKGFERWDEDSTTRGGDICNHLEAVCQIPVSPVYTAAYRRWHTMTKDANHFASWFGQLDGTRLFIGLGMAHVLETQVCRHPVYGIPYIPGSALKGLARAKAEEYTQQPQYGITKEVVEILFGTSTDDPKPDAGYLIFHDAWWVPGGEEGGSENKPYAPEIVTVHAVEYYKNQGKKPAPHPDMESPNPNQQLAVQGSFCFVIEGVSQWAQLGMKFLTIALQEEGIGGKVAAGYGYFVEEAAQKKKREALEEVERERVATQKAEEEAQRAAEDKKRQEKIAAEEKTKWLASLTLEKLLIHELNTLLDQHDNLSNKLGTAAKEIQSGIQGQVKRILKHNEWHLAGNTDKREALESIERSFPLLLKKNRKKKLDNAKRLLAAEDDE